MKKLLFLWFFFVAIVSGICQNNPILKIDNSFCDSSKYAVLSFKKTKPMVFDSSYIDATLSATEIRTIENLFFKCIADYNKVQSDTDFVVNLKEYFFIKQLVPVINKKGEKEVWINCFRGDGGNFPWREELYQIMDGGNDNFNLIINLSTKRFYGMMIGGYG